MNNDSKTFAEVFDALADTPHEAANLRAWADVMDALSALIARGGDSV